MSANSIQKYASVSLLDVLSSIGIPTATASQIYQDYLNKKAAEGVEILLFEIRQGDLSGIDKSEMISIIARYQRDAMEGVARNNLRLLARVISGMAKKNEVRAPSFSRYATILSSLTDKEIRILAVMAQHKSEVDRYLGDVLQVRLAKDKRHKALIEVTKQAEGHLQALMRTGLVNLRLGNMDDLDDSTRKYDLTKLMDEILSYINNFSDFGIE